MNKTRARPVHRHKCNAVALYQTGLSRLEIYGSTGPIAVTSKGVLNR